MRVAQKWDTKISQLRHVLNNVTELRTTPATPLSASPQTVPGVASEPLPLNSPPPKQDTPQMQDALPQTPTATVVDNPQSSPALEHLTNSRRATTNQSNPSWFKRLLIGLLLFIRPVNHPDTSTPETAAGNSLFFPEDLSASQGPLLDSKKMTPSLVIPSFNPSLSTSDKITKTPKPSTILKFSQTPLKTQKTQAPYKTIPNLDEITLTGNANTIFENFKLILKNIEHSPEKKAIYLKEITTIKEQLSDTIDNLKRAIDNHKIPGLQKELENAEFLLEHVKQSLIVKKPSKNPKL